MTEVARIRWVAAGLVLGALAAYHNTFAVPFVFDDLPSILDNPSLRSFAAAWSPPSGFGFTVSGRPLVNVSLWLNGAISGEAVWSYHVFNLLVHAGAGLALFGLIRRTLLLPRLAPRFGAGATGLAGAIALLWVLHPLQTESVTYVVQRAEAMMGLCLFACLYAFGRGVSAPPGAPARAWFAAAWLACLAGTACKEVMAVVPVLVGLYDRTFVAGGFGAAWRARRWVYGALLLTWLPLAGLVASAGVTRGGTFALRAEAFVGYWLTQPEAITRYLGLTFWPAGQAFDYGFFRVASPLAALPWAIPVLLLLGGTLWALVRRPGWGFLGAFFFLCLAPSSLMPGLMQVIVEHRMYVPLAAVLSAAGAGLWLWLGRRAVVLLVGLALLAGVVTVRRNADYATAETLWADTVARRPQSAIAQSNLGQIRFDQGRLGEAVALYQASLRLKPDMAQTHYNLGMVLEKLERIDEASACYAEAARLLPHFAQAHTRRAAILVTQGRLDEALAHLQPALAYLPELPEAHYTVGLVMAAQGRLDLARRAYADALRYNPDLAEARLNLGIVCAQLGERGEALAQLQELVRRRPAMPEAQANLGIVLAEAGRPAEAVTALTEALRLRPDYAAAHYNLGNALVTLQRWSEAKRHFAEAVRLAPDFGPAKMMLERLQFVPDAR